MSRAFACAATGESPVVTNTLPALSIAGPPAPHIPPLATAVVLFVPEYAANRPLVFADHSRPLVQIPVATVTIQPPLLDP